VFPGFHWHSGFVFGGFAPPISDNRARQKPKVVLQRQTGVFARPAAAQEMAGLVAAVAGCNRRYTGRKLWRRLENSIKAGHLKLQKWDANGSSKKCREMAIFSSHNHLNLKWCSNGFGEHCRFSLRLVSVSFSPSTACGKRRVFLKQKFSA